LGALKNLFSRKAKTKTVYDLSVAFHRKTAGMVSHGVIVVTNREFKLDNSPVRFAFVGCEHAPVMTPDVIYHIWTQAVNQGYLPHSIQSYKAAD
jgi:hypothetical protein